MADCGNVTIAAADVAHNFERLAGVVKRVAGRGALPVILGGDHAITFPAVAGLANSRRWTSCTLTPTWTTRITTTARC